jgi:uncharacterized membrane protein YeaQ/YmgE (transglycosylase-associated protein family)
MSIIAWTILGLLAGFIGSKIVNRHGEGVLTDVFVGIVGAWAGGHLFNLVGEQGVTGLNLWSLLVATTGAVLLLLVFHAIRRLGWAGR